ncbi:conserved hypothetical phage protein [Acinetobacter phage Acj61]|uniref:Conserved hypothetical phage protein n=1 Tax=Acinetobacter phage Acj61 TaxID=760732 RepID=E5E4B6_9CAUD|nr:membrane protein [Acinetobacter phage Acj61]ADG36100.1 conserved hypothetical phage protein [Acinetobacter phage Acj61]
MNIDMKSWHYRLNKLFIKSDHRIPSSLCLYFWTTALFSAILTAIVSFIGAVLFICGFITFMGIADAGLVNVISTNLSANSLSFWMYPVVILVGAITFALAVGVTFGLLALMIAITAGISMLGQKFKGQGISERINSSDNLVVAYIRSKHQKICPKLNFTYGEKK